MKEPLCFEYDASRDILTVEGVKYSGDLFRLWARGGMEIGQPFVIERHDGDTFAIRKLETS